MKKSTLRSPAHLKQSHGEGAGEGKSNCLNNNSETRVSGLKDPQPKNYQNSVEVQKPSAQDVPNASTEGRGKALRNKLLCPSAPADVNAIILGVVQSDGSVAFTKDKLAVTREFLDLTEKSRSLETRFRFSSVCHGGACKQWTNGKCSVPERVLQVIPRSVATDASLPTCSIRDQCRWFEQLGAGACRICPLVVTRGD